MKPGPYEAQASVIYHQRFQWAPADQELRSEFVTFLPGDAETMLEKAKQTVKLSTAS